MAPGRWRPRQRKQVRESRIHSHPLSPSPVLSLSIRARSLSFRLASDVGLLWANECVRASERTGCVNIIMNLPDIQSSTKEPLA